MYFATRSGYPDKQRRIVKTAMLFIRNNSIQLQPRFDVIEIITSRDNPMEITEIDHIQGAFDSEDLHAAF